MGRTRKENIYYRKGIEYSNQGNLFGALEYFSKAIGRNSDFSRALIFKGMIHFALGQYDESMDCYDRAIKVNRGNSWAWCTKGISLLKLGKVNEALGAANEAIKYAQKNSNALGLKGDCHFALGEYDNALVSYETAIGLKPNDPCNYIGKGESLLSLNRYNKALECFDKAIEIEKDNSEAWMNKGNGFFKQGRHDKALECLNQALLHNPDEGKAYHIKGEVFTSLGEENNALSCYGEAKKLGFPMNPTIVDHGRIWQITKVFKPPKGTKISEHDFLHEEMQMLLLKIGSEMGFDVWIAKNDKGKDVDGQRYRDIRGFITDFPVEIKTDVKKIVELIDVLWLEGNVIRAAFEVESTTSIYSGLLRLSDLVLVQPDNEINLYIVAPDDRREKVRDEIDRPTFSKMGLNENCRYIPSTRLRDEVSRNYRILKYLKTEYVKEQLSEPLS